MLFMSMALLVLNKDLILRRERGGVWGEAPFFMKEKRSFFWKISSDIFSPASNLDSSSRRIPTNCGLSGFWFFRFTHF